jgi:hypothetical protein
MAAPHVLHVTLIVWCTDDAADCGSGAGERESERAHHHGESGASDRPRVTVAAKARVKHD